MLLKNEQWNVIRLGKHPTIEIYFNSLNWEHHNKQVVCSASWQQAPLPKEQMVRNIQVEPAELLTTKYRANKEQVCQPNNSQ